MFNLLNWFKGLFGIEDVFKYQCSRGKTWYLHRRELVLKSGFKRFNYYFSLSQSIHRCRMPSGFRVYEIPRGGLPVLKKI